MRVKKLPYSFGEFHRNISLQNGELVRGAVSTSGRLYEELDVDNTYEEISSPELMFEPIRFNGDNGITVTASSSFDPARTHPKDADDFAGWRAFSNGLGNEGSYGDCWVAAGTSGEHLTIDIGEIPKALARLTFFRPNINVSENTASWTQVIIEGSTNGTTWVSMGSYNIPTTTTPVFVADVNIPVQQQTPYRYYKLTFGTVSTVQVGRIRMYSPGTTRIKKSNIRNRARNPLIHGTNSYLCAPWNLNVSPVAPYTTLSKGVDPTCFNGVTPTKFTSTLGITAGEEFSATAYGYVSSEQRTYRWVGDLGSGTTSLQQNGLHGNTMFSNIVCETETLFLVMTYSKYNGSNGHSLSLVEKQTGTQLVIATGRFDVRYLGTSPAGRNMLMIASSNTSSLRSGTFTPMLSSASSFPTHSIFIAEMIPGTTASTTFGPVNGTHVVARSGNSTALALGYTEPLVELGGNGRVKDIFFIYPDAVVNSASTGDQALKLIKIAFNAGTFTREELPLPVPTEYNTTASGTHRLTLLITQHNRTFKVRGMKGASYVDSNMDAPTFTFDVMVSEDHEVTLSPTQLLPALPNSILGDTTILDKSKNIVWGMSNSTLQGNTLISVYAADFDSGTVDTYELSNEWNRVSTFACGGGKLYIGNYTNGRYLEYHELSPEIIRSVDVNVTFNKRAYDVGESGTVTIDVSEPVRVVLELSGCQLSDGSSNVELDVQDTITVPVTIRGLAYASVSYVAPITED